MTLVSTLLTATALAACITFVTVYATTAPWRSTEWGRHMMAFAVCLGLLLGLGLAYRIFGDYPGRQVLLAVVFATFTVLLWQRVYLVIRAQRPPRRTDRP